MTRMFPHTKLHSSKLIRCLADLGVSGVFDTGDAIAEKLGQWIHFSDAITLSAVHNEGVASTPKIQFPILHEGHAGIEAEFDRTQALLTNSIIRSCSPNSGKTHIILPTPILELPLDCGVAYPPYRRFYEAHQRDMELSIQPVRINVRETIAKASPRLKKLAELDATLEKILRDRENKLLSKVPILLRKHFEQLFKAHQQKLVDTQQADHPVSWTQAGGWLAQFCNDVQMLLLAELELRLQPTMGLLEAFKQNT